MVRHGREESVGIVGRVVRLDVAGQHICSSGPLSSLAGGDSGSELADVSCSVTRRPDVSESMDVIVSDGRFSILVSDGGASFVDWYHDEGIFWRKQIFFFFFFFWRKRRIENRNQFLNYPGQGRYWTVISFSVSDNSVADSLVMVASAGIGRLGGGIGGCWSTSSKSQVMT